MSAAAQLPAAGPGADVVRWFAGVAESAHGARDFARLVLGAGHPCRDDADLVVTELAANAVAYTRSGWQPGGMFTVTVRAWADGALVMVRDQGAPGVPAVRAAGGLCEHGRGLVLVDALAAEWGTAPDGAGRVTWCRLAGPVRSEQGRARQAEQEQRS